MNAIEAELHEAMLALYPRTGRETGYWANYFLREVRRKGGLATAKRMLIPDPPSEVSKGWQALIDAGKPEFSIEHLVLQPRYEVLFTPAELAEAQRRLDLFPAFARRRARSAERIFPDEVDGEFVEGAVHRVTVNAYERNAEARAQCIARYGARCAVCSMSFEERYGAIGVGFIHVHHKKPLAIRRGEYRLRPKTDLVPVCPNCHAMLHTQEPPLGIEELQAILAKQMSVAEQSR